MALFQNQYFINKFKCRVFLVLNLEFESSIPLEIFLYKFTAILRNLVYNKVY